MNDNTASAPTQSKPEPSKPASTPATTKARTKSGSSKPSDKKSARADSKQAKMIAMLKREGGATIEQLVKALDWQPHSIRGAISGLLKKKLGLKVTSKKTATGVLSYRIR